MTNVDQAIMLDQPWQIQLFGYSQLLGRLKIEANNPIVKFRRTHLGTTLQAANHVMGTNFRNKKTAEAEFRKRLNALHAALGLPETRL